jgi:hypothetical protein
MSSATGGGSAADRPGSLHGVKNEFFEPMAKAGAGNRPFDSRLRLPGRTHGLNRFRAFDNAALLSVVNFTPNQYEMLHQLGLSDAEIDRSFGHNIVYQDALRCSLRERDLRTRVNIVVVDRATADDLGAEFPGCTVKALPLELVPTPAIRRKPGPKAKAGVDPKSTSRVRAMRARLREARERAADRSRDS